MKDYAEFGFELYHRLLLMKDDGMNFVMNEDMAIKTIQLVVKAIADNYDEPDYIKEYNKRLVNYANNIIPNMYKPRAIVLSPEDQEKVRQSNQTLKNPIDVIQTMINQVKSCDYKPTVTILSFRVKVKAFKVRNKTIHSQIKRVVKLFQRTHKNTTIDKIEYRIGLDGDDFVNDMNTVEFLFQVH